MKSNIKIVALGLAGCEVLEQIYAQTDFGKDFIFCQFEPNDTNLDFDIIPIEVKNSNYEKRGNSKNVILNWDSFLESLRNIECLIFITDMISYDSALILVKLSVDFFKESTEILKIGFVLPYKSQVNQTRKFPSVVLNLFEEFCNCVLTLDEQKFVNPNRKSFIKNYAIKISYQLIQTIKSFIYVIDVEGIVKWDFNRLKQFLENSGMSVLSFSIAKGENIMIEAVNTVLTNSDFNRRYFEKRKKYMVFVIGSEKSLTMDEYTNIIEQINQFTGSNEKIETCVVVDNSIGNDLQIIILTIGLIYPFPLESVLVDTVDLI